MATKTINDVYQEYRAHLLGLKPTANVDQTDSDHYIRGKTIAGVVSGIYADIERAAQDAFPQNARREALLRHKKLLFDVSTFDPATVADGPVTVTGTDGTYAAGIQMTHTPTGNVYTTTESVTIASGTGSVTVQSVLAGQSQNLIAGTSLSIASPPSGMDSTATVGTGGISDGTNEEDEARLAARLVNRYRQSARGGNDNDHVAWAFEVAGVTDASVLRYVLGFGTVGVIISSGTTDIDAALDAGEAIDFTPSGDLLTAVENHINAVNPSPECAFAYAPVEVNIDVTVTVKFVTGNKSTVLANQTLTQGQLVEREIKRAIYKTGSGGTKLGTQGYMLKKSIEDMIDSRLSANSEVLGTTLQIVVDRIVANLDGANANKAIAANERPVPHTITINDA